MGPTVGGRRRRPSAPIARAWAAAALLFALAARFASSQASAPPDPEPVVPGTLTMPFAWTLLPGMWVEIDLGMHPGSEAVAEFATTGGEIRWDIHAHPPGASPPTLLVLDRGTGSVGRLRFVPDAPGRYSYRWENSNPDGLVRLRVTLGLRGDVRVDAVKP